MVITLQLVHFLRVFLVDVGQNVQNGTNFNLTLSVTGLTTSVIFPVILQCELCVCKERNCDVRRGCLRVVIQDEFT